MRRWDVLADAYIEEYKARGVSEDYITHVEREVERWGAWLKRRRPKPRLEEISPDLHVRFVQDRTAFRAKSTVYGVISKMRGFGDYLVAQGVWTDNPLKWMQGPKLTPDHRMPKRIDGKDMKALWSAVATGRGTYQRHLGITILSILYGTGLRRGELARLNVADWSREEGTLRIDGRKTGQERSVPVPRIVYHCIETYLSLHLMVNVRSARPKQVIMQPVHTSSPALLMLVPQSRCNYQLVCEDYLCAYFVRLKSNRYSFSCRVRGPNDPRIGQ